jgi:hypothetical protein
VALILILNTVLDQCNPIILVGQELMIPNPDKELPTPTAVSLDISPATETTYIIQPGDTVARIAGLFNSTEEDSQENDIEDANLIRAVSASPSHEPGDSHVPTTPRRARQRHPEQQGRRSLSEHLPWQERDASTDSMPTRETWTDHWPLR